MKRRTILQNKNYLTFVALESGTFKYVNYYDEGVPVEYSLNDGLTWNKLSPNTNTPTIPTGGRISWKCEQPQIPANDYSAFKFDSSGKFNVEGNVLSVVYGNHEFDIIQVLDIKVSGLFKGSKVVDASGLLAPSRLEANLSFHEMFMDCAYLTEPPALPSMNIPLGAYIRMFYNCTSLRHGPSLPALSVPKWGYYGMYWGCTSLQAIPNISATSYTGEGACEAMFIGCTSLTTVPKLPATSLSKRCYADMFRYCNGLTTVTELPAETLAEQSYYWMFEECKNLNKVTCLATNISADGATTGWLSGVKSTGTFYKSPNMSSSTWPRGINGIPNNWSIQNKA